MKDLAGRFGLIVASHSAHLMVRAVRALASWLEPSRGRIIITGIPSGSQASHLIKSASKAGLLIVETALDGPWAVMTMALRRPAKAAVWEWSPGDWLAELDEEDREALARIEALEKSGRGQKSLREKAVFGGDERQGTRLETEEAAGQREEFELTDEGGPEDIEEL
jgi:hypothetical protein